MKSKKTQRKLAGSDDFAQYSLRSTFFVRKIRESRLANVITEVEKLSKVAGSFSWDERASIGIEEDAWRRVVAKQLNPLSIFCHPRVLTEQPPLLLYYRTVALLSQKGLGLLVGGNVAAVESGRYDRLDPEWTQQVVVAINSIVSVVVQTAADIKAGDLAGYQFAAVGATIQGSWNNAIGKQGEIAIKTILVNRLQDRIVQIVWRDGSSLEYSPERHAELIDRLDGVRVVRMKNRFHLLFSSEPDVSLRDPKDVPLLAIEVKAGFDSAGALERLGAAMKSFENDRNINPEVKTVYVVRCMTPELQTRIAHGNPFDYTFGLADLLSNERSQATFANLPLKIMLGRRR